MRLPHAAVVSVPVVPLVPLPVGGDAWAHHNLSCNVFGGTAGKFARQQCARELASWACISELRKYISVGRWMYSSGEVHAQTTSPAFLQCTPPNTAHTALVHRKAQEECVHSCWLDLYKLVFRHVNAGIRVWSMSLCSWTACRYRQQVHLAAQHVLCATNLLPQKPLGLVDSCSISRRQHGERSSNYNN
eukprot:1160439-Pelagomonas_calceolata.AAC.4